MNNPIKLPLSHNAFLLAVLIMTLINSAQLVKEVFLQKRDPFFYGVKFSGLNDVFKGIKTVGYYSDKDLKKPQHLAEYQQAQFMIAPTLLDFSNLNHPFILFDCNQEINAWLKIKELQLVPLKRNPLGAILARNPHYHP